MKGLNPRGLVNQHRQSGVALAIVVWFIAGMTLLVSGIVSEAKIDTRMAQLHYFRAQASAAGDGAIKLALAEQLGRKASGEGGATGLLSYQVGIKTVEVRMIPAGFFVNISSAAPQDLSQLFAATAAGDQASPEALAQAVVAYRDGGNNNGDNAGNSRGKKSRPNEFYAIEDILKVPGVSRQVFDRVRDYIVVAPLAGGADGKPLPVQARLNQIDQALDGIGPLANDAVQHAADKLRIDAVVNLGDHQWLRRQWIALGDSGNGSALPWQVIRIEAARPLPNRSGG